jgi:regulator of cell morphogenesis and NO signaling
VTPRDIRDYISDDNDRLDGVFKVFRDFGGANAKTARDLLHVLMAGIDRHIRWEEDILFPLFENRLGMEDRGPTAAMRDDHRKMKEVLQSLHGLVIQNGTDDGDLDRELAELLAGHQRRGEESFYPMLDHSLSDAEKLDAYTRMKSIGLEKVNRCCGETGMEDR